MAKKVIIESTVKQENIESMMGFLDKNLSNVREFEGCSQVKVFFNAEDGKMIFDEVWESIEHHHKYISFIAENGVMDELVSFLESPPEIKYFDTVDL